MIASSSSSIRTDPLRSDPQSAKANLSIEWRIAIGECRSLGVASISICRLSLMSRLYRKGAWLSQVWGKRSGLQRHKLRLCVDPVAAAKLYRLKLKCRDIDRMVYQVKDKDDFNEKVAAAGDKLVVIDFYATWCGPCKMISPILEEFSKEHTDVVFLKVDVDECDEIGAEYNIQCMPTFIFLRAGKKVDEFSGASPDKLKELIIARKAE